MSCAAQDIYDMTDMRKKQMFPEKTIYDLSKFIPEPSRAKVCSYNTRLSLTFTRGAIAQLTFTHSLQVTGASRGWTAQEEQKSILHFGHNSGSVLNHTVEEGKPLVMS